jgi:hypothetical protein
LILKNRKPVHRQILKFSETETRISVGVGEINTQVPVLSMTWVGGTTTSGRASGGGSAIATLFFARKPRQLINR